MMIAKAIPLDLGKDMPKEAREGLSVFMQAIIGSMSRLMQTAGDLSTLGNFCAAYPKPKLELMPKVFPSKKE
ncbi:unnamed protein product [marine sediment metagenome]|uniref:Uncharacterized protein n=1 Tax=marine sediment metagenome TaxID=412755 RepID=X1UKS5_9ZZZZ